MTRRVLAIVALGLAGCSAEAIGESCDFIAEGMCVRLGDSSGPARDALTPTRIGEIARTTADFYDLDVGSLDGWTLRFTSEAPFACGSEALAFGCADFSRRTITVAVAIPAWDCAPLWIPLAHEFLHAMSGDRGHSGAEWHDLNDLRMQLARSDPLCRDDLDDSDDSDEEREH